MCERILRTVLFGNFVVHPIAVLTCVRILDTQNQCHVDLLQRNRNIEDAGIFSPFETS